QVGVEPIYLSPVGARLAAGRAKGSAPPSFPPVSPLASTPYARNSMPTTAPIRESSKRKPPATWRLLLARLCLRIVEFELRRGKSGRVVRSANSAATKLARIKLRTGADDPASCNPPQ